MGRKLLVLLVLLCSPGLAWGLECYEANQVVGYSRYYHDPSTGSAAALTSPAAVLRITPFTGTATYATPAAPVQLNLETGRYGGEYTVPASPTLGRYELSITGTVGSATVKLTAAIFQVRSACALASGDAYARLGAPAGASVSADIAAVKALILVATVTPDTGNTNTITIPITETGTITASGQFEGMWLECGTSPRKLIAVTINGTPDTIAVAAGAPFATAPNSGTCTIWREG